MSVEAAHLADSDGARIQLALTSMGGLERYRPRLAVDERSQNSRIIKSKAISRWVQVQVEHRNSGVPFTQIHPRLEDQDNDDNGRHLRGRDATPPKGTVSHRESLSRKVEPLCSWTIEVERQWTVKRRERWRSSRSCRWTFAVRGVEIVWFR
ncbi:hypothetical protein JB92DRAFT_2833268 [Gautieria morchelliformis]|nr:hypothetical protein JB92DRAFT_2833268 [Gautieria morchelliformis]